MNKSITTQRGWFEILATQEAALSADRAAFFAQKFLVLRAQIARLLFFFFFFSNHKRHGRNCPPHLKSLPGERLASTPKIPESQGRFNQVNYVGFAEQFFSKPFNFRRRARADEIDAVLAGVITPQHSAGYVFLLAAKATSMHGLSRTHTHTHTLLRTCTHTRTHTRTYITLFVSLETLSQALDLEHTPSLSKRPLYTHFLSLRDLSYHTHNLFLFETASNQPFSL